MSLGDLLEGIVLRSFEGRQPFPTRTRAAIAELKRRLRPRPDRRQDALNETGGNDDG